MKSNFKEIFNRMLPELKDVNDIDINVVLDEILEDEGFQFYGKVTRKKLTRDWLRSRLTTALNTNEIYSFSKGHFVSIENANKNQLLCFIDKAERDIEAAYSRKSKAKAFKNQLEAAWDEDMNFIGLAVNE